MVKDSTESWKKYSYLIFGHHQIRHLEMIYKLKLLGEMLVFSRYSELNCQEESKHIMCLYMVESTLLIQSLSDSFYVMYFALSKCYQLNCRRSKPPTNYWLKMSLKVPINSRSVTLRRQLCSSLIYAKTLILLWNIKQRLSWSSERPFKPCKAVSIK